ncbi:MAG TPA: hypothetical protein VHR66_25810 [Gemmataceae bacterium]|jgi:hypothetical protein|nr:hypothetical protein [Gemmataceae bacterium]
MASNSNLLQRAFRRKSLARLLKIRKSATITPTPADDYLLFIVGINGTGDGGQSTDDAPKGDDVRVRMPGVRPLAKRRSEIGGQWRYDEG